MSKRKAPSPGRKFTTVQPPWQNFWYIWVLKSVESPTTQWRRQESRYCELWSLKKRMKNEEWLSTMVAKKKMSNGQRIKSQSQREMNGSSLMMSWTHGPHGCLSLDLLRCTNPNLLIVIRLSDLNFDLNPIPKLFIWHILNSSNSVICSTNNSSKCLFFCYPVTVSLNHCDSSVFNN